MKKERKKRLDATKQKNALQRICAKFFEPAISEVKFDWARTPDRENLPEEYKNIVEALVSHRDFDVTKRKQTLLCDFVLEEQKIILEYDEEQHFTLPRKISLENYPDNVKLSFSKEKWIEACRMYNRQDNNPPNRDEGRAYYDAIRDIEAYKHGYKLIRILHGEVDWEKEGAEKELEKLINSKY